MAWLSDIPVLCDDSRRNIHNHLHKLGKRLKNQHNSSQLIDFNTREKYIYEYQVFMHLKQMNRVPGFVGPSSLIDDVWHAHIVDTKNYRYFCNTYFGVFVEHDPNVNHGQLERAVEILKKKGYPDAKLGQFWKDEDEDEDGCGCG
jgi:hypothetical protein